MDMVAVCKTWLTFVNLLLGCFLMASCSVSTHTDYAFDTGSKSIEQGSIHYKFRGAMKRTGDGNSYSGSPYELFVWLKTNNNELIEASFINIKLSPIDSGKDQNFPEYRNIKFEMVSDGGSEAGIWIRGIELEHKDYQLSLDYYVSSRAKIGRVESLEFLVKAVKSEEKISLRDMFMGI